MCQIIWYLRGDVPREAQIPRAGRLERRRMRSNSEGSRRAGRSPRRNGMAVRSRSAGLAQATSVGDMTYHSQTLAAAAVGTRRRGWRRRQCAPSFGWCESSCGAAPAERRGEEESTAYERGARDRARRLRHTAGRRGRGQCHHGRFEAWRHYFGACSRPPASFSPPASPAVR